MVHQQDSPVEQVLVLPSSGNEYWAVNPLLFIETLSNVCVQYKVFIKLLKSLAWKSGKKYFHEIFPDIV